MKLRDGLSYDDSQPLKYDLGQMKTSAGPNGTSEKFDSEVAEEVNKKFEIVYEGLIGATPFTDQSNEPGERVLLIPPPTEEGLPEEGLPEELQISDDKNRLNPQAIEDLLIVCEYALSDA